MSKWLLGVDPPPAQPDRQWESGQGVGREFPEKVRSGALGGVFVTGGCDVGQLGGAFVDCDVSKIAAIKPRHHPRRDEADQSADAESR